MSNPARPQSAFECDLLLTGGAVVTMDDERRVLEPGTVAVKGEAITAVGTPGEFDGYRARRTIDCSGKAVIPGFVDCHNHFFQTLGRGIGEGMPLLPWLSQFMWPYASHATTADVRAAAWLAAVEAVRTGTTFVLDNHYSPTDLDSVLAVVDAIADVGLRGVVARGVNGPMNDVARGQGLLETMYPYSASEELDITRDCLRARPPGSPVTVWPAPLIMTFVDQSLTLDCIALAREFGTHWHTHCSETRDDPEIFLDAYGVRPADWLYEEGVLDARTTLAHGIWFDDREIERLGEARVGIVYNPISNQYLASGSIRLQALQQAGAVVGLGTDGVACTGRQDMFETMKQAILLQRVSTLDPESCSSENALEMATVEGARMCGINAGALAPGKNADLAVVRLDRPHATPLNRTVATLTYATRSDDVQMTVIGGRIVYENGRCTLVDEEEIRSEAQRRCDDLVGRAGIGHLRTPWRGTA